MVKVLPTEGSSPATTERTLYEVEEENVVSRGGRKVDDDDNNILAAVERTNQQVDRPRVDSDPSNAHFVEDRRRSGTEQNYQIAQAEASGTPSRKQSLSERTVLVKPVDEIMSLESEAETILMASPNKPAELPDRKL